MTSLDATQTEAKALVPDSPQPPAAESLDGGEDRADGGVLEASLEVSSSAETCASSFPGWIKSPDRGLTGPAGLNFSPVNSNLRDLTPSHTLEPLAAPFRPEAAAGAAAGSAAGAGSLVNTPAPFSEGQGQLFYPTSEDAGLLAFSRSLTVEGSGDGGGSGAHNPPQKKKVMTVLVLVPTSGWLAAAPCWRVTVPPLFLTSLSVSRFPYWNTGNGSARLDAAAPRRSAAPPFPPCHL